MRRKITAIVCSVCLALPSYGQSISPTPQSPSLSTLGSPMMSSASSMASGGGAIMPGGFISSFVDSKASEFVKNWLATDQGVTEFSLTGITNGSPVYDFLVTRPLYQSEDHVNNLFLQTSLERFADRTTANFGLGYRNLAYDKKLLLGINSFYDQEFPYNHQRMSVGGEIRTTIAELNTNYYVGLSDWKDVGNDTYEKALGGYDAELGISLPYMPSAKLRAKTFRWYGLEGADDLTGQTYSIGGKLPHGFAVEAGHTDYNSLSSENYVKLTLDLVQAFSDHNNKSLLIDVPYRLDSMEDQRFDKVRRENRIVKQTKGRTFSIKVTGF
jgi:Inverse autotransporter, beta-domain